MDSSKTILNYSVIIPVYNEEKYLRTNLEALVNQSLLPLEIIIVDDGSTDDSSLIVNEFICKYHFVRLISSGTTSSEHQPGSKIVNAFYKGFEQLEKDWDFIVKLDADTVLPKNYFEKIAETFQNHPKTGIAGGIAYIEKDKRWVSEGIGNKKQVRGPFKSYTKACFEKIGGLRNSIGWDTADELIAMYNGFEVTVLPDLKVKLLKPTGVVYQDVHGIKMGESFYKLDYGWLISMIAASKAGLKKRSFKLFFDAMKGYFSLVRKHETKAVTKEEARFIRKYRWQGILSKIGFRN